MTRFTAALAASTMLAAGLAAPASAQDKLSGELTIFSDMSNPAPRAVMEDMVERFGEMHPELDIELTVIDREAYKTQIRNFLSANPPDVANWYAANRMRPYVEAGLFEDVSDLWAEPELAENLASTKGAMTIDGKQWGVPYTYYQWGVYYREDIYEELGLEEPGTWEELKGNCQAILDSGRTCFTIGTRFLWTAGGWFDYINMRTNGYDFHMALTNGEESWTSDEVRQTFSNWRELIDMGAFIDDHQSYSWQEAVPFMTNGEAVHYLMGNFAVEAFRDAGLGTEQLDFFQFPAIDPDVELAEDAPTDTFHIPSGAENKEAARAFLRFVVSAENQTAINAPEEQDADGNIVSPGLGQLPVNASSSVADDEMLNQGFAMLSSNSPGGVAQFFDRDAPAEMASVAIEGFQEFMVFPDNLEDILQRLEQARERIY
jgi:multiple sugar transport system substrate-binding protein